MSDKHPYFWAVPILVGIVFVLSNFFWLVPFIDNVRSDAERYQVEVAERISSQADFFIEKTISV